MQNAYQLKERLEWIFYFSGVEDANNNEITVFTGYRFVDILNGFRASLWVGANQDTNWNYDPQVQVSHSSSFIPYEDGECVILRFVKYLNSTRPKIGHERYSHATSEKQVVHLKWLNDVNG